MVNILAFSDIHRTLKDQEQEAIKPKIDGADIVITLGDILKETLQIIAEQSPLPILSVRGCYDDYCLDGIPNIINMHRKVIEVNGLKIAGLDGRASDNQGINLKGFSRIEKDTLIPLDRLPKVDVMMSHFNPLYFRAKSCIPDQMPQTLAELLESKEAPRVSISGQIHRNIERTYAGVRLISVYTPVMPLDNFGRLIELSK